MKQATCQILISSAKRLWATLGTYQDVGWFASRGILQVPASGDPHVRLPNGMDLRASGPGFHNQPAQLELLPSGEALLRTNGKVIRLGMLSQRVIESGWIITGLRLRGALRFAESQVVLMVPDREDIPYLLRVLSPCAPSSVQALPQYLRQAA